MRVLCGARCNGAVLTKRHRVALAGRRREFILSSIAVVSALPVSRARLVTSYVFVLPQQVILKHRKCNCYRKPAAARLVTRPILRYCVVVHISSRACT